jgi:hypothetical protein
MTCAAIVRQSPRKEQAVEEEREASSSDEREAVASGDDVEGHMLTQDEKSAVPSGDDDEERRAFPDGT